MQLVSVSGMGDKVKVMLSVIQDKTQALWTAQASASVF